MEVIAEPTGMC